MGKGEENTDKSDDESTPQPEAKPETAESEEETEEKTEEKTAEAEKPVEENKEEGETKKVDDLRKVIKVDQKTTEEEPDSRESLEQKRAILQSIKDFDFQIKKNQEEITAVNKKLDSVTKDLDDLVSLYEIVSEQMNPFVGLSKVTKKRIDALENFTKEIDDLKNRMGDIESFAVKAGADLNTIRDSGGKIKDETEKTKVEVKPEIKETGMDKKSDDDIETVEIEIKEETPVQEIKPETPIEHKPAEIIPEAQEIPIQETPPTPPANNTEMKDDSQSVTYTHESYDYFDEIIEKSLKMMSLESQMDRVIDEFIESLKA